jgi:protein XagA
MRKGFVWGCVAAACAVVPATAAGAAAWTLPAGEGRTIVTGIYSHSGDNFDANGHAFNANNYNQYNVYFQTEYGLTDNLTLLATPSLRRVTVQNGDDSFGLGYTEVGARYKVADTSHLVFSLQASAFIPGQKRSDRVAQIGSTDAQFDMRAQVGYSFDIAGVSGFASAEGAYRVRTRDMPNEVHGDFTLGLHATKKLLFLASNYNTWSDGAGRNGFPFYRYSSVYAGGVYDVTRHLSVQLGGIATVSGRNALRERGVYTGFWVKF